MNQLLMTPIRESGGCGKTFTLLHEITEKEPKYKYILTLCPTIWINKTYPDWKYLESDVSVIGLEIGSDKLNLIVKHIIDI